MKKWKFKPLLSLLLAAAMLFNYVPAAYAEGMDAENTVESEISDELRDKIYDLLQPNRQSGLVGFEDENALAKSTSMVPIVVELASQPAMLEKITREVLVGDSRGFDLDKAEDSAKNAQDQFISVLEDITGGNYKIRQSFDLAFNGFAVTVPEECVEKIAKEPMVYAVYPDPEIIVNFEAEDNARVFFEPEEINFRDTEEIINEKKVSIDSTDKTAVEKDITEDDSKTVLKEEIENNVSKETEASAEGQKQFDMTSMSALTSYMGGTSEPIGMGQSRKYYNIASLHNEGLKGSGVSVAVIDTGIDYNHPELDNAFASSTPSGNTDSDLLVDGKFYGRNYIDNGKGQNDPLDDQGHGTHVSGTIGGRGKGSTIQALGMAPEVTLAGYKVITSADSIPGESYIGKAAEDAVKDGFKIMSMSLGYYTTSTPYHATTLAINNLAIQHPDVLFVICAGNTGPGAYTLWSPSTSPFALTVANVQLPTEDTKITASTANGSYDLRLVRNGWNDSIEKVDDGIYKLAGGNANFDESTKAHKMVMIPTVDKSRLGTGTVAELTQFETEHPGLLNGSIVVIARGQNFDVTLNNLKKYTPGGFIVINNYNSDAEISFYQGPYKNYIPLFTIGREDGYEMIEDLDFNQAYEMKLTALGSQPDGTEPRLYISSSRGPVSISYDVKPDIAAVGTAVLSSVPQFYAGVSDYDYAYAPMTGTSMATPHVSGIAALLRQKYPDASANEIKAKLMNTADEMTGTTPYETGAGMLNPVKALEADSYALAEYKNYIPRTSKGTTVSPVGLKSPALNFGMANYNEDTSRSLDLTVFTASDAEKNFAVSVEYNTLNPSSDVTVSVDNDAVAAVKDNPGKVSVSANVSKIAAVGNYSGFIVLKEGSDELRIPFGISVMNFSEEGPLDKELTFIDNAVISTGSKRQINMQNYGSSASLIHTSFIKKTPAFSFFVADKNGNLIGEVNQYSYSDSGVGNKYYWTGIFDGYYHPYTYSDNGTRIVGERTALAEGMYKLVFYTFGTQDSKTDSYYMLDFYVDNTLPQIRFSTQDKTGSTVGYTKSSGNMIIKGNIYDAGTEEMIKAGLNPVINKRVFGNITSQQNNIVVAEYDGKYYRGQVDTKGNFVITIPENAAVTVAKIFYGDHFLPVGSEKNYNGWNDNNTTTGFDPEKLSYRVEKSTGNAPWMTVHAYRAANMDSMTVKLKDVLSWPQENNSSPTESDTTRSDNTKGYGGTTSSSDQQIVSKGSGYDIILPKNSSFASIDSSTVKRAVEGGGELRVVNKGSVISLSNAVIKEINPENKAMKVQAEVLSGTKATQLLKDLKEKTGMEPVAGLLNADISIDGKSAGEIKGVIKLSFDLKDAGLTEKDLNLLSGIKINKDGTVEKFGGEYDRATNTFSVYAKEGGVYSLGLFEDLMQLKMGLNSNTYAINGKEGSFDTAPVIIEDRTMVPVRLIGESMGASVTWDDSIKTAVITLDGKVLRLTIGSRLEGMDVPAQVINNRTMVPLRFVAEYFKSNVIWNEEDATIRLVK